MKQNVIFISRITLLCVYFYTAHIMTEASTATHVRGLLDEISEVSSHTSTSQETINNTPIIVLENINEAALEIVEKILSENVKYESIQCIKRIDGNKMYIAFLPLSTANSSKNILYSLYDMIASCVKKIVESLKNLLLCTTDEEESIHVYETTAGQLESDEQADRQPTIIPFESCKNLQFSLTVDQSKASQAERKEALAILSKFCNTQVEALSNTLNEQTPHIAIVLALINVELDDAQDDIIATN